METFCLCSERSHIRSTWNRIFLTAGSVRMSYSWFGRSNLPVSVVVGSLQKARCPERASDLILGPPGNVVETNLFLS